MNAPFRVAIIGTAPTSRMLAPFDNPEWQIWACSAGNVNLLPRVNIWFEMHMLAVMLAPENRAMAEPFYAWLKEKSDAGVFQVVMPEAGTALGGKLNTYVPKAVPYPLEDMVRHFGTRNWFTSSVAYMMALAITRGATEIALFGVDMAADSEHYSAQRAGCTWFREWAENHGIKVHVPMESCLAAPVPLYGYWEGTPFGRRLGAVMVQVQASLNNINAQAASLRDQQNYFAGAMEQLRYFERTWVDGTEIEVDIGTLADKAAKAAEQAAEPLEFKLPMAPAPAAPAPVYGDPVAKLGQGGEAGPEMSMSIPAIPLNVPAATVASMEDYLPPEKANGALHRADGE